MKLAIRPILYLSSAAGGCCAIATPIALVVGKGASTSKVGKQITQVSSEEGRADRDNEGLLIVKCSAEDRSTEVEFGTLGVANVCWKSELQSVEDSKFSELFEAGWTNVSGWANLEQGNFKAYCKTEGTRNQGEGSSEGLWPISKSNPTCEGVEYLELKNSNHWVFLKKEKKSNNYKVRACIGECWNDSTRNSSQRLQNWAIEKSSAFKEIKFYS